MDCAICCFSYLMVQAAIGLLFDFVIKAFTHPPPPTWKYEIICTNSFAPKTVTPGTFVTFSTLTFLSKLENVFFEFYIHGSVNLELNWIIVQQDATYSVYYFSVGSSTCFGCWHPSLGGCTAVFVQQDATYSVYYISAGSSICFVCWHPPSEAGTAVFVQQDATYSVYYISAGSSTCFGCWHPSSGDNKWIPNVRNTWISFNLTKRTDGSRYGQSIPESVITAVPAPDDGCQHPKHVELPAEMQ